MNTLIAIYQRCNFQHLGQKGQAKGQGSTYIYMCLEILTCRRGVADADTDADVEADATNAAGGVWGRGGMHIKI